MIDPALPLESRLSLLTGWVLGQLPDGEEDVARAESTAIEVALRGLAV